MSMLWCLLLEILNLPWTAGLLTDFRYTPCISESDKEENRQRAKMHDSLSLLSHWEAQKERIKEKCVVPFRPWENCVLSTTKPLRDWFCSSPSSSSDETSTPSSTSDSCASSSKNWRPFRHLPCWQRKDGKCQGWRMLKVPVADL